MSERIDGEWTRKLAWRVHEARSGEARIASMIPHHGEYIDCTTESIAAHAIESRHRWAWAGLGLLRWLHAEWPRRADDEEPLR